VRRGSAGGRVPCRSRGLSVFDLLRYRQHDRAAVLCAFDLIELDGRDLRKAPIEQRKDLLAKIVRPVRRSQPGITLNDHYEGDGAMINEHAPVRLRRHRIEAARLTVPIGAHGSLAQDQESGKCSVPAGSVNAAHRS
jgi:hypothetical protein